MRNIPAPKTQNPHEKTWDHHGSYQWIYFEEEIKQLISFFLSRRLTGKNLDLGGGWYLTYPNSTVVDLSQVCLDHNPAKDKLHFDLDEIATGERLPYSDRSFDSATFISSWQYLKDPKSVIEEVRRVLKPGAEVYIVNMNGAGLTECIQSPSQASQIASFLVNLGYDTLIENLPCFQHTEQVQSVCAAMPEQTLFEKISQIRNKTKRIERNRQITSNTNLFLDEFVTQEIRDISRKLAQLKEYPVTAASQEYQAKVERESQEYLARTGKKPYVFLQHSTEMELSMTQDGERLFGTLTTFGKLPNETEDERKRLPFSRYMNYFTYETEEKFLEDCATIGTRHERQFGTRENIEKYLYFLTVVPLNSFTRELQQKVYDSLKPNVPDLDLKISKLKLSGYYSATQQHKQKRKIDEWIAEKQRIEQNGIPTIGMKTLDTMAILNYLKKIIADNVKGRRVYSLDD